MTLTQIAVNDNVPPHGMLIKNGTGDWSAQEKTVVVKSFTIVTHLPIKDQRYFFSGQQGNTIHTFRGTVHEANNSMVFFKDVKHE